MLQTIRERLTGWFAVFILGAIALTLVVTFGNIDTGFSGASAAANVNGDDISVREFRQLYQQQRQQWEANYRTQLPDALAEEMADSVIQSLVRNRAVAQHVSDQGYRVNDDEVISSITENSAFYVGGQFSQPAYEQLLNSQGISTQRFEYEQRQSMQISQFVEGIGYTAFYTPSEFRRYIELDGESRNVAYVILAAKEWQDKISIDDDQLQQYYDANLEQFRTEESVALDFIEVDFNALAEDVDVSIDEALEYYEANPDEFRGPDERRVRHILIPFGDDEAAALVVAEEARAKLLAGESFDQVAAEYSADTGTSTSGGDLGWLGSGDSPAAEFEDVLFVLEETEISDPVRTEYGFHLIRLDGIRAGNAQEFSEIQEELVARLKEDTAADVYSELLDELDERALESLNGLKSVAEALNLELAKVDQFTRSGGLPLGYDPQLVDVVFSLEVLEDGENSPVIDLGDGRAVVVHVTEHRMPVAIPLEDVRETILEQLLTDESIVAAAEAGVQLVEELNAGATEQESVKPFSAEWVTSENIERGSPDIPADLVAEIFSAPKPSMVTGPGYQGLILASGDFAVFKVSQVNPGQPEIYSVEDRNQRKTQLANRVGGAQASATIENLVKNAKIRITPDLVGGESDLL